MLERGVGEVVELLEEQHVSREELAALLRSEQAALVHAAVVHLNARLRGGDWQSGWEELLPTDSSRLPAESQLVLAALAVDGFGVRAIATGADAAPLVRLAWLRAELLEQPERLSVWESAPLGWEAVKGLPVERVLATGLLERLVLSASANVREAALDYVRKALIAGYLSRSQAHAHAVQLAHDVNAVTALGALRFLKEPWSFGLPLPALRPALDDGEVTRALVHVWAARGELEPLRRALRQPAMAAVASELLVGLGQWGDGDDVGTLLEQLEKAPLRCGKAAVAALVALKRRGISSDEDDARALLALLLAHPVLGASAVAEVLSSRADIVLSALDEAVIAPSEWPTVVALLEAFGTRRALERLQRIVTRVEERDGWWYALNALGRLGLASAERDVLARLDDEPDACLAALRSLGGAETVAQLRERLAVPSPPVWARSAAQVLFELAPSTDLLADWARRGLLDAELLDAAPGYAGLEQTALLGALCAAPGHPVRRSAIRALGRTAGPLAVNPLAEALGDADEAIREEAERALRALGVRLHALGAARPACLRAAADPGAAMVADAALQGLRQRPLDSELAARLLTTLTGSTHPQLVPVVRPYLRHREPEVKKRALACLAHAGPAAAAWLLPSLDEDDLTIARQALIALEQARATGVAGWVARWLDQRNMNLKKAAAKALATLGDRTVMPKLVHWLQTHDNPGFRELLVDAASAIVGDAFVGVIASRLDEATDERARELLLDALEGRLSAEDIAGMVRLRDERWTSQLLRKAYGGDWSLRTGTLAQLDDALERRGLSHRLPASADTEERVEARRAGLRLRSALRERSDVARLLARANVHGQSLVPSLSRTDVHRLLDVYPELDEEARQGALRVLGGCELDAVARLRVAQLARQSAPPEVPATLMRHVASTTSPQLALELRDSADHAVQNAATRTLLLAEVALPSWPERDAGRLLEHLVLQGALAPAFEWSLAHQQLPALAHTLARLRGNAFAAARIGEWLAQAPALLPVVFPELVRLGSSSARELERIARSSSTDVDLRERALAELARSGYVELQALASELLGDAHAALRERAALVLLELGDVRARERALSAYLAGAFRERFSLSLSHADLPLLERAVPGPIDSRSPLVRLLQRFHDARQIPLLLQVWQASEGDARAQARDALRALNGALVWAHVAPLLEREQTSPLDVVGSLDALPESLVSLLRESTQRDEWYAFIERVCGAGPLHAPGLAALLLEAVSGQPHDPAALRLLVRLDDWSNHAQLDQLLAALTPRLRTKDRERWLSAIVDANAALGSALRIRILAPLALPTDEPVVVALLQMVLEQPLLRDALPAPLLAAVERRMVQELDGEPELVRRVLSYLVGRAGTELERHKLVEQLEQSLRHSSSRVRAHALRLLRHHAPYPRYLSATTTLLGDRDPSTVRSAIRVLGFGRHAPAVPAIVEHLAHAHIMVRDAARAALLHLGDDAVPALKRAVGHARPDRRAALESVLADVERGVDAEETETETETETEPNER